MLIRKIEKRKNYGLFADIMADVQFPELAKVGTSYELVRPDLGLTIHITEPLITVPETRGKTTIWTIASKFPEICGHVGS